MDGEESTVKPITVKQEDYIGTGEDETTDEEGETDTPPPTTNNHDEDYVPEDLDDENSPPSSIKNHDEEYVPDKDDKDNAPPLSTNNQNKDCVPEDENYEVDLIVDMKVKKRSKSPVKFRVRWLGYGEKDDTWLPYTELQCEDLINEFLEISGRMSEYKNAIQTQKKLQDENDREVRHVNAKLGAVTYKELDEDDEEDTPSLISNHDEDYVPEEVDEDEEEENSPPTRNKHNKDYVHEDENCEVEQIVDMVVTKGKCPVNFRVRWVGYGEKDDTWEPSTDMQCEELINEFLEISGRLSEYENAIQDKKELQDESDREKSSHSEDDEKLLTSRKRSRKNKPSRKPSRKAKSRIKTPAQKKQFKVRKRDVGTARDETTDDEREIGTTLLNKLDEDDEEELTSKKRTRKSQSCIKTPAEKKQLKVQKNISTIGNETRDNNEEIGIPTPITNNHNEDYMPEEENYEVDQIVDMEVNKGSKCPIKFRVRWVGYGEKDDTWEPSTDMQCEELITEFLEVSGRMSEYENAIETKEEIHNESHRSMRNARRGGEIHNESHRPMRNARRGGFFYCELDEDDEEAIPSRNHIRKCISDIKMPDKDKQPKPAPNKKKKIENMSDEYEVEGIIDHRVYRKVTQYKVHWKGCNSDHDSWLPKTDLQCNDLIKKYHKELDIKSKDHNYESESDIKPKQQNYEAESDIKPKEQNYKVKSIQDMQEINGRTEYKVRWVGRSPKYDSWLTAEELNCPDILNKFLKALEFLEKQEDWQVKKIVDSRETENGKPEYLVQWVGWEPKFNTWEPEENLEGCNDMLKKYKKGKEKGNTKKFNKGRKIRRGNEKSQIKQNIDNEVKNETEVVTPSGRSKRASGKRSYTEFYDE